MFTSLPGDFAPQRETKGALMKKLPKKLTLAKETLLYLQSEALKPVLGGGTLSACTVCANTACANC
jgi:hypothetical protein